MSTHNIHLKYSKNISHSYLHCASWCITNSNLPRLELPLSRTNFNGHKRVRAIKVRLWFKKSFPGRGTVFKGETKKTEDLY